MNTYIQAKVNGRHITIVPCKILFLKAEGCYTRLFISSNEEEICISKPLCILKVLFSGYDFIQCHRSVFINTQNIDVFDSKKQYVKIEKHLIKVSRRKSTEVFRHLSVLGIPDTDLNVCL